MSEERTLLEDGRIVEVSAGWHGGRRVATVTVTTVEPVEGHITSTGGDSDEVRIIASDLNLSAQDAATVMKMARNAMLTLRR